MTCKCQLLPFDNKDMMSSQDPIVTEMADVSGFTSAESYHQQYLERGGRFGKAQSAKKNCDDPIRCYG